MDQGSDFVSLIYSRIGQHFAPPGKISLKILSQRILSRIAAFFPRETAVIWSQILDQDRQQIS